MPQMYLFGSYFVLPEALGCSLSLSIWGSSSPGSLSDPLADGSPSPGFGGGVGARPEGPTARIAY